MLTKQYDQHSLTKFSSERPASPDSCTSVCIRLSRQYVPAYIDDLYVHLPLAANVQLATALRLLLDDSVLNLHVLVLEDPG